MVKKRQKKSKLEHIERKQRTKANMAIKAFCLQPGPEYQERQLTIEDLKPFLELEHPAKRQSVQHFIDQYQEGDEITEYCMDEESWNQLRGSSAICLSRGDQHIATLFYLMN